MDTSRSQQPISGSNLLVYCQGSCPSMAVLIQSTSARTEKHHLRSSQFRSVRGIRMCLLNCFPNHLSSTAASRIPSNLWRQLANYPEDEHDPSKSCRLNAIINAPSPARTSSPEWVVLPCSLVLVDELTVGQATTAYFLPIRIRKRRSRHTRR